MEGLSKSQQAYYDYQVNFWKSIKVAGRSVAVPYGIIYDDAKAMGDDECDMYLALNNAGDINAASN